MANSLDYILSLNGNIDSKLAKIGINSDVALSKFAKLQKQTTDVNKVLNTMGTSVGSLKSKLDLLKAEREWIPSENLTAIKKYNQEIGALEKQITKLETAGGGWGSKLKESLSQIPGIGALTNPIVAVGGAMVGATKMSLDFDRGMAAINTTAQLAPDKLAKLKNELLSIDPSLVKDWSIIPETYESIISQTGDVALSTDIMKTAIKGAKAGFTDASVVAAALGQSLSLIGKENASAEEVLDTFFAAKRVGAGEFQDFAQYMPSLIASGDALGIKYKEVAGMFAYMTGKGQSAEKSTVLMENAFSAMSKIDVRKNLASAGVNVFDAQGSIRSMTDIFSDLKGKMDGMSDEAKSSFLAKMGLTDKEARSAFIVMTSDIDTLKSSMDDVKNSMGETTEALRLSASPADRLNTLWSQAQVIGIKLGGAIAAVLTPALQVVGWVGGYVADTVTWLVDGFSNADPVVIGLAAGVTALTIAYKWSAIAMKAQDMWLSILLVKERLMAVVTRAKAIAMGIATVATWAWEVATIALNAAFLASPIGWVVAGAVALGAAVYGVTKLMNQQTAAERLNGEVKSRATAKTMEQRAELDIMFQKLRNARKGTDEYKTALQELGAVYPGIIEKYNLQSGSLDAINAAHRELVANIDAVAQQEARKELLKENYKKKFEAEEKLRKGERAVMDYVYDAVGIHGTNQYATEYQDLTKDNKYLADQIAKNELSAGMASSKMDKYTNGPKEKVSPQNSATNKMQISEYNTEESIKARIKELQDKKEKQELHSKDWKISDNEIKRLESKLNPGKGGGSSGRVSSKSNEAIATGGSKQTTINLTFDNIVGNLDVRGKDFQESKQNMETQTTDAIVRALNMATSTAG